MRQSASNHSLIPIRANTSEITPTRQKKVDAFNNLPSKLPTLHNNNSGSIMTASPKRGLGISVSASPPSRVPVRASPDRMRSIFASATMVAPVTGKSTEPTQNRTRQEVARAQNPRSKLSEPFQTPLIGSKEAETPSPTYSNSISPSFIVRNLDEDPHTGSTPTYQTYPPRKPAQRSSRLNTQLPSPPSSPNSPPVPPSKLPRRSKDDLSLA